MASAVAPLSGIYARLVLTTFFWGGTFIAGRYLAQSMPHFLAATLRFSFALLGLWSYALSSGRPLVHPKTTREWSVVVLLGATGICAYNAGFFAGLAVIPASRAALIVATSPIMTLCAVHIIQRTPWSATQISGVLMSSGGAMLVISGGNPAALLQGAIGYGEIFIFGAVFAWVLYTLATRYLGHGQDALSLNFYSILCGTLMLGIPASIELATMSPGLPIPLAWLALAYLGLCGTSLSFVWYTQGVARIGAARATQFTNLVPVFGVLLSALLLGEHIAWSGIAGGTLVIAGVMLCNRHKA